MEDGVNAKQNNDIFVKMGATGNPNTARLATLQERKKTIEESLAKCNQELRELCIQEADLTGTIPLEMPLEPGESPPLVRRRVGTAYQLPENLIKNVNNNNNNKDETITDLELQIQLHANMAEAALGLANEQNISKTLRRQHMTEYQQHKLRFTALQDKLTYLKEKLPNQNISIEHKQKKKQPRPTIEQEDNTSLNEIFIKSDVRHSMRSNKTAAEHCPIEQRYSTTSSSYSSRMPPPPPQYKSAELYLEGQNPPSRHEDVLASGLYRLSINGYKNYIERREDLAKLQFASYKQQQNTMQYSQHHNSHIQINQHQMQNLQQNPLQQQQHNMYLQQQQHRIAQGNTTLQYYNYSTSLNQNYHMHQLNIIKNNNTLPNHHQQQTITNNTQLHRQSSSPLGCSSNTNNIINQKLPYYHHLSHTIHGRPSNSYHQYTNSAEHFRNQNTHQQILQPHQQYEQHSNILTSGLGGYWKRSENGEMIWCNANNINNNNNNNNNIEVNTWQRDKRFGSLDRRKNKRLNKKMMSPNVENRSATLVSMPTTYNDYIRTTAIKSPQAINRRPSQDNRQLVRTQSLGSVGAQTIDSVWPSDDNSSCESDSRNLNDNQGIRKHKQKEWLETSLDGPVSPSHSISSHSSLIVPPPPPPPPPSILSPEEKYIISSGLSQQIPISQSLTTATTTSSLSLSVSPTSVMPRPTLEIPAESNPSPRIIIPMSMDTTNVELFNNNNIPKNCTIVQAGHCKPYHEETKPFEMSDFYKYSTKFKKSPQKQHCDNLKKNQLNNDHHRHHQQLNTNLQKNLNEYFDDDDDHDDGKIMKTSSIVSGNTNIKVLDTTCGGSLNSSLDLSNVAEHFSDEMNTWYKNQRMQIDNNVAAEGRSTATTSKCSKSAATLV